MIKVIMMIVGADQVESYDFGMIESSDGEWWYSQSHHECLMIDGKMIDGGREYTRGKVRDVKIRDGELLSLLKRSSWMYPDFVDNMDFS